LERDALRGRNQTMAEIADKIYRNMPAPKYFLEIRGAHHLSFVNQFITELFEGNNRLIFEVIRRYTIAFLKKHISGRREAETILDQQDSLLTRYLRTL
ncbi:MAG TPA: hypothetical protein PK644_11830, partial [bacterium]|nr:hypothetical protein [bacterium]